MSKSANAGHPHVSLTRPPFFVLSLHRQTALEREGFPFALADIEAHEESPGQHHANFIGMEPPRPSSTRAGLDS